MWIHDVTKDGDVESNPGPEQNMHMDPEAPPSISSQASFQSIAPKFSQPSDAYSPRTLLLPTGQWFEQRPLPPSSLFSVADEVLQCPVELFSSGDGLPCPTLPENMRIFDLSTQHLLDAPTMAGKHTFIFLPRPLPFSDTPAAFSLRSWTSLIKAAMLMQSPSPTLATLVIQSRFDSPSPTTLPILDRRFELDPIRRFLLAIRIFPDFRLLHRDTQEGNILHDRLPTAFPLMMFLYSSSTSFSSNVSCEVWLDPSLESHEALHEDETAVQVILNAACVRAPDGMHQHFTGLQLLKILNGMEADEASTNLRHSSCLKFPPDFVPNVQRASPSDHTIAHYHVPPYVVQHLMDDKAALQEVGIEWAVMNEPLTGSFIVNHLPRTFGGKGKATKHQSPEVRDSLLAIPSIAQLLESVILISKWDVWIRPYPGVAIDLLAAQVHNLDNLCITDAAQLLKVHGPKGAPTVSPPSVLASFSARLLPTTVLAHLSRLLPIASHQQTHRPGLLLLRMAVPEVASLVYGVVLPSPHGSITLTSGTDVEDTRWETSLGLGRGASWDERAPLLHMAAVPPPLSAASLLGHEASLASEVSPNIPQKSKAVAAIFSKPNPLSLTHSPPKQPQEDTMPEN
jgi:hypothetical protein